MCVHTFAYISTQIDHSNPPGNTRATPSAVASLELDPPLAKSSSADQVSSAVPALSWYWRMGGILVSGCLIGV